MARSGGFGSPGSIGGLTLDPFGGGGSSLGRYELGDTLSTIQQAEHYAVSVGWQNGTVTDDAYLKDLHDQITEAGTDHERIAAQNRYDDAVYTIGRNKLVRAVNDSASDTARVAADRALIAYDQKHLGTMDKDNEQYRELVDRIAGTKADIRATLWNQITRSYNENKTSDQAMADFARRMAQEAKGAPDEADWQDRAYEFTQRVLDDKMSALQHDYEMGKVDGSKVLAFVNGRLATMDKSSPRYQDLSQWRDNFAKSFKADEAAQLYSQKYDAYQEGKIGDDEWLRFLHQRVQSAEPGSEEQRAAKHDLVMETFRITENKLIYDVQVNGADPHELIRFYKTSLVSMDHDSARALDIQQKIQNLELHGVNGINLAGPSPESTDPSNYGHFVGGNPNNANSGGYAPNVTGVYGPGGGGSGGGKNAAEAFVSAAMGLLGTPYVLGAESANATDCSGLIYQAFEAAGLGSMIDNQRRLAQGYTNYFANQGQFTTDRSQVQRGDLVVYGDGNRVTHIGIYLGGNKVLSALTTGGVRVTRVNGLNVNVKGFLLVNWAKAPANFTIRPAHTPSRPERPRAVPSAPDDSPESSHVVNVGPRVAQVDPGLQHAAVANVDTTAEQAPRTIGAPAPKSLVEQIAGSSVGKLLGFQAPGQPRAAGPAADNGSTANIPGALLAMAQRVVQRLGGNPNNEESVRAVATWITTESGSQVANNNPFNLATATAFDLPGEIGRTEQGLAVFRTWQDGVDAAAAEIARHYPTIAAGVKQGNAQAALSAVEQSNWRTGGYGDTLIPKYNQSGPSSAIIGTGKTVFQTPQSLQGLAAGHPEITALFNINAADPTNKDWFDRNLNALADAMDNQAPGRAPGQWWYVGPDGHGEWLPFSPDMYFSALEAKAGYQDMPGSNWGSSHTTLETLRNTRTTVTIDQWRQEVDALKQRSSDALKNGDLSHALSYGVQAMDATRALLGLPPGTPLDTKYYPGSSVFGGFTADQLATIQSTVNTLLPAGEHNPQGNPLLGLLDPNVDTPTGRPAIAVDVNGRVQVDPNAAYFTQDNDGNVRLVTWQNNAADFEQQNNRVTLDLQAPSSVPAYMNGKVQIMVNGSQVPLWLDPHTGDVNVAKADVANYRQPSATAASAIPFVPQAQYANGQLLNPDALAFAQGRMAAPSPVNTMPIGNYAAQHDTTPPPAPASQDIQVTQLGASIPLHTIRFKDQATGEWFQAYSFDDPLGPKGQATWIFQHADATTPAPMPVLNSEWASKVKIVNGQLYIPNPNTSPGQQPLIKFDPNVMPIGDYFHWFGTAPDDQLKNGVGALGQNYPIRTQIGNTLDANFHGLAWWDKPLMQQQAATRRAEIDDLLAAKHGNFGGGATTLGPGAAPIANRDAWYLDPQFNATPVPTAARDAHSPFAGSPYAIAGGGPGMTLARISGSTVASQARFLAASSIAKSNAALGIQAQLAVRPAPAPAPVVQPTIQRRPQVAAQPAPKPVAVPRRQVPPEYVAPTPRTQITPRASTSGGIGSSSYRTQAPRVATRGQNVPGSNKQLPTDY